MLPKVIDAKYKKNYIIYIRFSDGTEGDIDLQDELYGELFEPLKDKKVFKMFSIHPDFHTLYWPNGADIAPEYLYEKFKITGGNCKIKRFSSSGIFKCLYCIQLLILQLPYTHVLKEASQYKHQIFRRLPRSI